MTREHKLALIIGFTLVLVVGVLISDHMSRASRVELDGSNGSGAIALTPTAGGTMPLRPPGAAVDQWAAAQQPTQAPIGSPEPGPRQTPPREQSASRAGAPERDPGIVDAARSAIHSTIAGATDVIQQGQQLREQLSQVDVPAALALRPNRPQQTTAGTRRYTVKSDDTLFRIAWRFYGDGNAWRALAAANEGRVGSGGQVRVGVALTLPASLNGLSVRDLGTPWGAEPTRAEHRAPSSSAAADESGPRTYTVRRGDTLGEIAMRQLGTVRRLQDILDLNKDKLDDADDIRVGMKLRLPTR